MKLAARAEALRAFPASIVNGRGKQIASMITPDGASTAKRKSSWMASQRRLLMNDGDANRAEAVREIAATLPSAQCASSAHCTIAEVNVASGVAPSLLLKPEPDFDRSIAARSPVQRRPDRQTSAIRPAGFGDRSRERSRRRRTLKVRRTQSTTRSDSRRKTSRTKMPADIRRHYSIGPILRSLRRFLHIGRFRAVMRRLPLLTNAFGYSCLTNVGDGTSPR